MTKKPNINSAGEKELEKVTQQFDAFEKEVKDLTLDRMNAAPKKEVEEQTKLSQKEIERSKDLYLKPSKSISCRDKFNEKFREQYNFAKEYVQFIAENHEVIGEKIEIWTRPFGGLPCEFWEVPVNKPVWGPRYLAEQISRCQYHKLSMKETPREHNGVGQFYGNMVVDSVVNRLDARPVTKNKSVFMGASGF